MTYRPCKCQWCQKNLDRNIEDFIVIQKGYAHTECNNIVIDIHKYMQEVLGSSYVKTKIDTQLKEMMKDGVKSLNGIKHALYYWYDIKGSDPSQAYGGINIVKYIYGEALDYYQQRVQYQQMNSNIEIKEKETQEYTITLKPIGKPKRINLFDLK